MAMSRRAEHGDKVVFKHPDKGCEFDQELARKHLQVDEVYTVDVAYVHSYHTDVFLIEVPRVPFSNLLFEDSAQRRQVMTTTGLLIVPRTCPGCGQKRVLRNLYCTPCEEACDHDDVVLEELAWLVRKKCRKCHRPLLESKRE